MPGGVPCFEIAAVNADKGAVRAEELRARVKAITAAGGEREVKGGRERDQSGGSPTGERHTGREGGRRGREHSEGLCGRFRFSGLGLPRRGGDNKGREGVGEGEEEGKGENGEGEP